MPAPDALITFLPVRDLEATDGFYRGVLGLPLAVDQGSCRIYRVAGGGFIGFCQHPDAAAIDGVIVTLVTDDVDGWHARLTRAGVATDGSPRHNPTYAIRHFYTRDPDGWAVEVQRFDDASWSHAEGDPIQK
ncbi:MAG: VOC family protein [Planctomycetota bacterium]|jgi:catechol 2,3-dioxygenase-like lactoylglutathione lyase family enzyme